MELDGIFGKLQLHEIKKSQLELQLITQNCVINYIELTHEKTPDSYEKTLEH